MCLEQTLGTSPAVSLDFCWTRPCRGCANARAPATCGWPPQDARGDYPRDGSAFSAAHCARSAPTGRSPSGRSAHGERDRRVVLARAGAPPDELFDQYQPTVPVAPVTRIIMSIPLGRGFLDEECPPDHPTPTRVAPMKVHPRVDPPIPRTLIPSQPPRPLPRYDWPRTSPTVPGPRLSRAAAQSQPDSFAMRTVSRRLRAWSFVAAAVR